MMHRLLLSFAVLLTLHMPSGFADTLSRQVKQDYDGHLAALFDDFHRNPELSTLESKTAARLAKELVAARHGIAAE
jgi:hypothetical protein